MPRHKLVLISMLRRVIFGFPIAVLAILAMGASASAGFEPYVSGNLGYDYSYIQCATRAPTPKFGIVGVNAGYPFTYYNSCLSTEFAAASKTGNAAVYINTGYDPSYTQIDGRHTTQDCADKSASVSGTPAQQAAWAVGCSEAQRDESYATAQSAATPKAWWLDVETSNSWSSSDLSLNRLTIQGILDTLRPATAVPIGVYSTSLQWNVITGGYKPPVDANWVATGQSTLKRAKRYCSSTGFTGAKVWLVQYVTTYDRDYVC
jgi:hypothetical protein